MGERGEKRQNLKLSPNNVPSINLGAMPENELKNPLPQFFPVDVKVCDFLPRRRRLLEGCQSKVTLPGLVSAPSKLINSQ